METERASRPALPNFEAGWDEEIAMAPIPASNPVYSSFPGSPSRSSSQCPEPTASDASKRMNVIQRIDIVLIFLQIILCTVDVLFYSPLDDVARERLALYGVVIMINMTDLPLFIRPTSDILVSLVPYKIMIRVICICCTVMCIVMNFGFLISYYALVSVALLKILLCLVAMRG